MSPTQAWVRQHPKTAAAFVQAIEEGQTLADNDPVAVRAAMAVSDQLTPVVTAVMALPDFPTGPVDEKRMQRTAEAMLAVRHARPAVRDRSRAGNPRQIDDRPLRAGARARTADRSAKIYYPERACSFSSAICLRRYRWVFPLMVLGSSATNSTVRGYL